MPQSLTQNLLHLIYSTKERRPQLTPDFRDSMHAMSASVLQRLESPAICIGGVEDHVHILFSLSKKKSLVDVVRDVKANTSKWANEQGFADSQFQWQSGYGAFSVSQSNVIRVKEYIQAQDEHHKEWSFQDEFRAILKKHKIEYDERYVWD